MWEEEIGELSDKMREFLRILEVVRPSRFITNQLEWSHFGRPMCSREKLIRAFFLKTVYDLPTTKLLIESLLSNPSWRMLCGWEYRGQVPSAPTFSRAFADFAAMGLGNGIHEVIISERSKEKVVFHSNLDSTAINGRERACRKNTPKKKLLKKRGRKSAAEKAEQAASASTMIQTKRLDLQPNRSLDENLADLPTGCDWGGKRNSKDKVEYWCGYKMHMAIADSGVPIAAVLTSASVHDSQVAIPLMQMTAKRAQVLYDLADSAYDAPQIKNFSSALGHVPIIDPNKRRGDAVELDPAKKIRYRNRTAVERGNSELKDNYGARHVRVKGHLKVQCHLMFGIIAIAVKQLFNMIC
jgi:hypothetical protein